jgi:phage tail tube protein FII
MAIPSKLIGYRCYFNGVFMEGTVDVTLPNAQLMKESMKGGGILGETDMPVPGNYGTFVCTITFHAVSRSLFVVAATRGGIFDIRAAVQEFDNSKGQVIIPGWRFILNAIPHGQNMGKIAIGENMGTAMDMTVIGIRVEKDSVEMWKHHKFNYVDDVLGVSTIPDLIQAIGLGA